MNRIEDSLYHNGSNKELIQGFISHGVEFVIVGGLAVAWYCRERQADDMDILINPTPENSARISFVLKCLRLQGFSEDSFAKPALQVPLKQHLYAELLTPRLEDPTYAEVADSAVDAKLFHIPVSIASPAMLIRMKELAVKSAEAQRGKHHADIECLKKYVA